MSERKGNKKSSYAVHKVSYELASWQKIKTVIEGDCLDEQCLFDTLDGETELVEALCAIKESVLEDEIILKSLNDHIKQLKIRQDGLKGTIDSKNNIILSTMVTAEIPTIKGPLFTLSKATTAPKISISNEGDIPPMYWKPQDPILDKVKLKKDLNDKQIITGVTLSNGGVSLKTRIL